MVDNSRFFVCFSSVILDDHEQLRGGCSAAFGVALPGGGEALGIVAEVAQAKGLDFQALTAEIRRCVAAEHGASLSCVRLLRPRYVAAHYRRLHKKAGWGRREAGTCTTDVP